MTLQQKEPETSFAGANPQASENDKIVFACPVWSQECKKLHIMEFLRQT
jgi:hypothetical protein